MKTAEEIKAMKERQAKLAKRIKQAESRVNGEARKADTHIKAALGGEVLRTLFDEASNSDEVGALLQLIARADSAITKDGLARELFNKHKATLGL